MGPEEIQNLNEIKATVLENNILLKKLVRQGKIALWSKVGYFALIILITVGAFALIKPMMGSLLGAYAPDGIGASLKSFSSPGGLDGLRSLAE